MINQLTRLLRGDEGEGNGVMRMMLICCFRHTPWVVSSPRDGVLECPVKRAPPLEHPRHAAPGFFPFLPAPRRWCRSSWRGRG